MNLNRLHIVLGICLLFALDARAQLKAKFGIADFLTHVPDTAGCIPFILEFLDSSTYNGNPITYVDSPYFSHQWDFGYSGQGSTVQEPVYGYFTPDTFIVTLVVTNDGHNYDTARRQIIVYDPPIVDMVPSVTSGCDPLNVCFTDRSSTTHAVLTEWLWDFGDGAISPLQNPCHT